MSTIDPTSSSQPPVDRSRRAPILRITSRPEANPAAKERTESAEVLIRVARRLLEQPPRDLQKLSASITKYFLTSLEPALELAKSIRHEADQSQPEQIVTNLDEGRRGRTLDLLGDRTDRMNRAAPAPRQPEDQP